MLQQPLLSDVGIRCSGREGAQLLHRCREQAARQFGTWSGGPALAHRDIAALLVHVTQVEVRWVPTASGCFLLFLLAFFLPGGRAGGACQGWAQREQTSESEGRATVTLPLWLAPHVGRRGAGGRSACTGDE